jgi:hypothetical protein
MEASSTFKNSVEMVVVIHASLLVSYVMVLKQCRFNDFSTMMSTNNNRNNNMNQTTFNCQTQGEANRMI